MQAHQDSEHVFQEHEATVIEDARTTSTVLDGSVMATTTNGSAKAKDTSKVPVKEAPRHSTHSTRAAGTAASTTSDEPAEKPLTAETEGWWRWTWRNAYNSLVALSQTFYTTGEAMGRRQAPDTKIIVANNNNYWEAPPTEAELKKRQNNSAPLLPSQIPAGVDDDDDVDLV